MKKKTSVFFAFFCMAGTLFAQETTMEPEHRFSAGAGLSIMQTTGEGDVWASIELGFLLYAHPVKRIVIRNTILLEGASVNSNHILLLSDKISFGTRSQNGLFRYYGIFQGGIGVYENENKDAFELPLAYNLGVGIGLDVYVEKNMSIFFEYLYLGNLLDNKFLKPYAMPKFQMGIRGYF